MQEEFRSKIDYRSCLVCSVPASLTYTYTVQSATPCIKQQSADPILESLRYALLAQGNEILPAIYIRLPAEVLPKFIAKRVCQYFLNMRDVPLSINVLSIL